MKSLHIVDYTYDLPEEAIAQYPAKERSGSRLLQWKDDQISDHYFTDLPELISDASQLVYNNTKVINARMIFQRSTGARIELFLLQPVQPRSMEQALAACNDCTWECLIGGGKRWKLDEQIFAEIEGIRIEAAKIKRLEGATHEVKLTWDEEDLCFSDLLERLGKVPLPPYMRRDVEPDDPSRYQTTYAVWEGSVAAPTAGLHFTSELLEKIRDQGTRIEAVTLHVGAGTFKPVASSDVLTHEMHAEMVTVSKEFVRKLYDNEGARIAVGTTTLRSLESLYWLAVRMKKEPDTRFVHQWDPYKLSSDFASYQDALEWLLDNWPAQEDLLRFDTAIMITPHYEIKSIDALITNFHMPKSTLLLLIGSVLGGEWKRVYGHALNKGYRFLSYGDSNLLWLNQKSR